MTRMANTDPVVLRPWWRATPIIHRRRFDSDGNFITDCGNPVGRYDPILRWDHAQRIGRPCKRCFRD